MKKRDVVAAAYKLLEPDQEAWLTDIVGKAGNLSLRQQPSTRRTLVAWALVRLAAAGMGELLDAVLDHAQVSTGTDAPAILAGISAEHAKKVGDIVTALLDDKLAVTVTPDGTYTVAPF